MNNSPKRKKYPSQAELRNILDYCASGKLFWKSTLKGKGNLRPGRLAGTNSQRYRYVMIDGVNYLAHVLIFIYHYGYRPEITDHINRNTFDNRIENLRPGGHSLNGYNRKKQRSISGERGVSIDRRAKTSPYRAHIRCENIRVHLGCFGNIDDAVAARKQAENKYFNGIKI
jgi:hypothetical protein